MVAKPPRTVGSPSLRLRRQYFITFSDGISTRTITYFAQKLPKAHHLSCTRSPGLGFIRDFWRVWTVIFILQTHIHACRQCLVNTLVDHGPPNPKPTLQFRDRCAIGVAQ